MLEDTSVRFQAIKPFRLLSERKEGKMAEWVGFEPTVPVLQVRVFSKDLVSATHPPLRAQVFNAEII